MRLVGLIFPLFLAPRRNERLAALIFNVLCSLGLLAMLFVSAVSFAQTAAAPGAPVATQPVWVTLLLQLGPFLIGGIVLLHPMLKLGAWLHADAKKRTGVLATVEEDAGIAADDVDAYVTKNGQSLKDLIDPAKRAAAEEALVADAKAEAKQAVDDALKRALQHG